MQSPPSSVPAAPAERRGRLAARGMAVAAGLVLAAALAACSSSAGSPAGAAPSPNADVSPTAGHSAGSTTSKPQSKNSKPKVTGKRIVGLITFKGTLRLSGASSRHVSFRAFPGVTRPASSCASLAAKGTPAASGQDPQFRIPAPPAGSSAFFSAEISPYRGAGSYDRAQVVTVGASFTVGTATYTLGSGATASATFSHDGSGTFSFAHAAATGGGKSLSGKVSWKCSA